MLKKAMEDENIGTNRCHRSITSGLLQASSAHPNVCCDVIDLRGISVVITFIGNADLTTCCDYKPIIHKGDWRTETTCFHDHHFIILQVFINSEYTLQDEVLDQATYNEYFA